MGTSPFDPLRLGPVESRNRILLAPVKTALGAPGGAATAAHAAYYRRRAAGGVGLLISEPLFVDPRGKEHPKQLGIDDDGRLEGLRAIVDAVHAAGGRIFAHLNHAGAAANPRATGMPPEAPAAITCPTTGATAEELSGERIAQLVAAFGAAARRAAQAGFDGVEVQLGLGYLAAQFLSPRTNSRGDGYGGDLAGRLRFAREIAAAVAAELRPEMAWIARLSADERVPGGLGLDDAITLGREARAWGAAGLHVVTGAACTAPAWYYQHMSLPAGVNESLAGELRAAVGGPVIVAGRLGDPDRIRALLAAGTVDAVALGRPLLADPDFPRKMREGREAEIQLCGSCLQGCLARVKAGGPIGCIVNPEVGHELEPRTPAPSPRHVVVVGGGPAGLQAALAARARGHRVTLVERDTLGGQFRLAPLAPGKGAMARPLWSLVQRAEESGVTLRLGEEATVASVLALGPDEVILATGSEPARIPVPGLTRPLAGADVLTDRAAVGARVLVVGGGLVGIEVAEHLGGRGVPTVVVELLDEIARDMEAVTRTLTLKRLATLPVEVLTGTRLTRLVAGEAFVRRGDEAAERSLGRFDSVVVAVGSRSVDALSAELRARGIAVHLAGDAARVGQVWDATQSGEAAVRALS